MALETYPPEEIVPPRSEQDILSEILSNTRSLSNRMNKIESESKYKPRSIKNINFDKNAEMKIIDMISSGEYSESEIINSLLDYDMPKSYARKLVEKHLVNRKYTINKEIANK